VAATKTRRVHAAGAGGAPDEDRRGGFERGGWAIPLFDTRPRRFWTGLRARRRVLVRPADLRDLCRLLGSNGRSGDNPIALSLNTLPNHVASLTDPRWAETTVLYDEVLAPADGTSSAAAASASAISFT
jgi:hypothetical protein